MRNYHFNPRAPCGARQVFPVWNGGGTVFQSTRPVRGATGGSDRRRSADKFQSTRPVRGATFPGVFHATDSLFQSTRPVRGATAWPSVTKWSFCISIHAPRAGRDPVHRHLRGPG